MLVVTTTIAYFPVASVTESALRGWLEWTINVAGSPTRLTLDDYRKLGASVCLGQVPALRPSALPPVFIALVGVRRHLDSVQGGRFDMSQRVWADQVGGLYRYNRRGYFLGSCTLRT